MSEGTPRRSAGGSSAAARSRRSRAGRASRRRRIDAGRGDAARRRARRGLRAAPRRAALAHDAERSSRPPTSTPCISRRCRTRTAKTRCAAPRREKPCTSRSRWQDAGECDAMVAACAAAGVPLWVGYYRRALPRFLAVRDLASRGRDRRGREVVSRQSQRAAMPGSGVRAWRADPARSGGGAFLGRHTLDFLDFLVGPLGVVDGRAESRAGDARSRTRRRDLPPAGGVPGAASFISPPREGRIPRNQRYDGTHPVFGDAQMPVESAPRRSSDPVDRQSAACAAAADPDYRRRDQWPWTLSEHPGVGGAHGARRRRRLAVVARAQPRRRRRDA